MDQIENSVFSNMLNVAEADASRVENVLGGEKEKAPQVEIDHESIKNITEAMVPGAGAAGSLRALAKISKSANPNVFFKLGSKAARLWRETISDVALLKNKGLKQFYDSMIRNTGYSRTQLDRMAKEAQMALQYENKIGKKSVSKYTQDISRSRVKNIRDKDWGEAKHTKPYKLSRLERMKKRYKE